MSDKDASKSQLQHWRPAVPLRVGTASIARRGMEDLLARETADQWYEKGLNLVSQGSHREAVECFERGIKLNEHHVGAQYYLGYAHLRGWGESIDYKESATWFREAADQGSSMAQSALGLMYRELGDYSQAAIWHQLAAGQEGMSMSSERPPLFEGRGGIWQDYDSLAASYCIAAAQGDELARDAVEKIWGDLFLAAGLFVHFTVEKQGHRVPSVVPNQDAAWVFSDLGWRHDQDSVRRVFSVLGWMFEHGRGALQHYRLAAWWYSWASAQGDAEAQKAFEKIVRSGRVVCSWENNVTR